MAYSLSPWLKPRFFITGTNRPLAGGLMYTYKAGTTDPATTYSDDAGTTNTNPIVLDSDGQCDLFLDDAVSYRIILKDAAGVTQFDKDNISSNLSFVQTGTGAVARTMQEKMRESVSVKDFGAIGDGTLHTVAEWIIPGALGRYVSLAALQVDYPHVTATTDSIDWAATQAALDSGKKNILLPEGEFRVNKQLTVNADYITLYGTGRGGHLDGGSRLICDAVGANVIYAKARYKLTFKDFRIETTGSRLNNDAFHLDGCVWAVFDSLHIHQMGRHGIYGTDTGTIYSGCYPVIINKCHIVGCVGDAVNIVGQSGLSQMNGIYISNCELQACDGSGVTVWGTNVVVRDNIIEAHGGYAVKLANGLASGIYSSEAVTIDNNYFEKNDLGMIYGEVGAQGVINGLQITGNFGVFDEGLHASYVPAKFVMTGPAFSFENAIRGLRYEGNDFHSSASGATAETEADFANAPNTGSFVATILSSATTSGLQFFTVLSKFKNLGSAQYRAGLYTKVLSGFLQGKGGSGIVYSGLEKSDNITVSGSSIYFPADLTVGARIDRYQVPVDTDATNYTIRFQLLKKSNEDLTAYSDMHNITKQTLAAGPALISTGSIWAFNSNMRKDLAAEADTILKVTVTWTGTPPTYFYLGNPTIFHS